MSQSLADLSAHLISTGKKYDLEKIERAYRYAEKLHEGQFRQSGEPYISHPLAVAEIVAFARTVMVSPSCAAARAAVKEA